MYGLVMARPKSTDPKVAITIRLAKSVKDAWDASAANKGLPNGRSLMEAKLTEAVHRPEPVAAGRSNEVEPHFRK